MKTNFLLIRQKLILICITFSLPIGVLLFRAIQGVNYNIQFNQNEIYGNEYQRPLERLLLHISEHKLTANRYLSGDTGLKEEISAKQSLIDKDFAALEKSDGRLKIPLKTTVEELANRKREHYHPDTLKKEWEELKSRFADIKQGEMDKRHTRLISGIRALISHIGDTSNLILDPDLDTYYLMDVTLLALPQTQDRLQKALSYGEGIIRRKTITLDERIKLNEYAILLKQSDLDRVRGSVQVSLNEDENFLGVSPSLQKNIPPALEEYTKANEAFIGLIKRIANLENVEPAEYISVGTEAIKESFELWNIAADENDKMIRIRVDNYEKSRLITLVLTLLSTAVSLLFVFFIVRNLKQAQSQLIQAGKLAALGEMSSGIAHELNNPLYFVKGFNKQIEGLIKGKYPDAFKDIMEYTQYVDESCERMKKIIQHLREFSRQSPHEFVPVSINEALNNSFILLSEQLRLRSISVSKNLAQGDVAVNADINQLEQVFMNIITNCRDAIEEAHGTEGGEIIVSNKIDGSSVVVEFKDNGRGIKKELLEKIFEPFFTTKEVGKGTGLGLSISYGIIKGHKGEIVCKSQAGAGTTMQVILPLYIRKAI
ncbi:MAG: hypothetical protein HY097_07455 [Nitrospinae bacterium]|nr:hypothetical protein [Nitrospinota bacterium]